MLLLFFLLHAYCSDLDPENKYVAESVLTSSYINIVYPDVTTPLAVSHGAGFFLIPPLQMSAALGQKLAQKRG